MYLSILQFITTVIRVSWKGKFVKKYRWLTIFKSKILRYQMIIQILNAKGAIWKIVLKM